MRLKEEVMELLRQGDSQGLERMLVDNPTAGINEDRLLQLTWSWPNWPQRRKTTPQRLAEA